MKVKTKYISTVIIFCLIVFFTSCESENFIEEPKGSQNEISIQLKKINFNELRANTNAIQKLNEVSSKNGSITGRSFYHEDYSIFLDTTNIIMIEQYGNHSITFQIINENSENEIQNLILNSTNDGTYNAYIATYSLSQEELNKVLNGETLTNKAPSSVNDLNQYARSGAVGDGADCVDFWTYTELYCRNSVGNIIRDNGELGNGCVGTSFEIEHQVLKIDMDCMSSGGGNNGSNNPGSPGTNPSNPNTGTGGGGSTNPIITTPLLEVNRNKLPCDQLKNLKSKTGFTSKMTTLKNNIGGTREKGFILRDMSGNDEFSEIVIGDATGNITYPYSDATAMELEKTYRSYGTGHNHLENHPDHIGIFTPEDLGNLYANALIEVSPQNPYHKNIPEKAIVFVITKIGLFALKVNDLAKLQTFAVKYSNLVLSGRVTEYLNKDFLHPERYNIRPTSTYDEQVTGFLRFMKDEDLGIDLYEGNKSDFGGWKKLSLIDNGNGAFSHSAVPCN